MIIMERSFNVQWVKTIQVSISIMLLYSLSLDKRLMVSLIINPDYACIFIIYTVCRSCYKQEITIVQLIIDHQSLKSLRIIAI